jgi:ribonuclease VapC
MIVVDTSALLAILKDEPLAPQCMDRLEAEPHACISAGTLSEALIVANRYAARAKFLNLIAELAVEVVPVDADTARFIGEIYGVWGKGNHPAALNFGDCFAYALAQERDCPLLFVGDDFARTDVVSALG